MEEEGSGDGDAVNFDVMSISKYCSFLVILLSSKEALWS